MKIAVTASGPTLDSPFDMRFGRCSHFLIVDSDTLEYKALDNAAAMAAGGAGIQAAQMVANEGVEAIVTGNIGPNAYKVLATAKIKPYMTSAATARQAVEQFKAGAATEAGNATAAPHSGMGGGMGRGMGGGMGRNRQ